MYATPNAFWNRIAVRYAAKPIPNPDAYEATVAHARSYLTSGDTVLEQGCGTGTTAMKLAPHVQTYLATDFAPLMVDIGRDKAWNEGETNLTFQVAEPGSAVLQGQQFDAVTAFNLYHLINDIDEALHVTFQQVRPGGYFISKTPCLGGMGIKTAGIRALIGGMRMLGFAPNVNVISGGEWVRRIRQAGFEVVEITTYPAGSSNRFVVARRPELPTPR